MFLSLCSNCGLKNNIDSSITLEPVTNKLCGHILDLLNLWGATQGSLPGFAGDLYACCSLRTTAITCISIKPRVLPMPWKAGHLLSSIFCKMLCFLSGC